MSDKQEPLIVYCFRHDGQGAIVLVGEDPAQMVGPGMLIEDAGMPEPDVAGLWAWVDEGSEPSVDPETEHADDVHWRGHWRRPTPDEMRHFTTGVRIRDSKPNVDTLTITVMPQSQRPDAVLVPTPVRFKGPVRG